MGVALDYSVPLHWAALILSASCGCPWHRAHWQVGWASLCSPQKPQGLVLTRTLTGKVNLLLRLLQVGPDIQIFGQQCDVTSPAGVAYLTAYAESVLGTVDVWINNAGYSGSFQVSGMHCRLLLWQLSHVAERGRTEQPLASSHAMQTYGRETSPVLHC